MRARITSWSVHGLPSRGRALVIGAAVAILLSAAYGGVTAYRQWRLELNRQALVDWKASEARRAASRYGDVRVHAQGDRGDKCKSYAFDNLQGGYVGERDTACDPPEEPKETAGPGSVPGSIARIQGLAAGFKR